MKKQKIVYRVFRYEGKVIKAKREVTYEFRLVSRLMLDELCFSRNKQTLEDAINYSIDHGDRESFMKLSEQYRQFIWE